MPIKPPLPRHTVQQLDNGIRVILPTKKNVLRIIWFCVWIISLGCVASSMIVYVLAPLLIALISVAGSVAPEPVDYSGVYILVVFMSLFILVGLSMGSVVIYSILWQIVGQEIIEIDAQVMSVSRKIFAWKKVSEYSSESINDLRVGIPQHASFGPMRSLQYFLGQDGIIAFDYGAKTFRFGLEIDEAEAKQIIAVLKPRLPEQKAG